MNYTVLYVYLKLLQTMYCTVLYVYLKLLQTVYCTVLFVYLELLQTVYSWCAGSTRLSSTYIREYSCISSLSRKYGH